MNKKGFTLIEIIIAITLISIVALIGIVLINKGEKTEEEKQQEYIENIKTFSAIYVETENDKKLKTLKDPGDYIYIQLKDLIAAGLLKEETINPFYNNKNSEEKDYDLVKIFLNIDGNIDIIYPTKYQKKEIIEVITESVFIHLNKNNYEYNIGRLPTSKEMLDSFTVGNIENLESEFIDRKNNYGFNNSYYEEQGYYLADYEGNIIPTIDSDWCIEKKWNSEKKVWEHTYNICKSSKIYKKYQNIVSDDNKRETTFEDKDAPIIISKKDLHEYGKRSEYDDTLYSYSYIESKLLEIEGFPELNYDGKDTEILYIYSNDGTYIDYPDGTVIEGACLKYGIDCYTDDNSKVNYPYKTYENQNGKESSNYENFVIFDNYDGVKDTFIDEYYKVLTEYYFDNENNYRIFIIEKPSEYEELQIKDNKGNKTTYSIKNHVTTKNGPRISYTGKTTFTTSELINSGGMTNLNIIKKNITVTDAKNKNKTYEYTFYLDYVYNPIYDTTPSKNYKFNDSPNFFPTSFGRFNLIIEAKDSSGASSIARYPIVIKDGDYQKISIGNSIACDDYCIIEKMAANSAKWRKLNSSQETEKNSLHNENDVFKIYLNDNYNKYKVFHFRGVWCNTNSTTNVKWLFEDVYQNPIGNEYDEKRNNCIVGQMILNTLNITDQKELEKANNILISGLTYSTKYEKGIWYRKDNGYLLWGNEDVNNIKNEM